MLHVSFLSLKSRMTIHLTKKAKITLLIAKKVIVLAKYLDFANVFSKKPANVFSEQIGANEHAVKLEKSKLPPYRPIYSLWPVKFKTFKTYIKINLANKFIRASKSPASALILFFCRSNSSFHLCVNYWVLNNLIIKNRYLLPLIRKSLDRLGQAKQFTQLNLTSAYY